VKLIPGYDDDEKAKKLVGDATALLEQYKAEGKEIPTVAASRPSSEGGGAKEVHQASQDAKSQAEERLREELAQLNAQKENE